MTSDSSRIDDVPSGSSELRDSDAATATVEATATATVAATEPSPAPFEVAMVYPSRGSLTQYRLVSSTNFKCSRCKRQKKAKLVATRDSELQWDALLCNGCYGFLLSMK